MPKGLIRLSCDLYDVDARNAEIEAQRLAMTETHGEGAWTSSYDERDHSLTWSYIPTPAPLGGLRDGPEETSPGLL